ncbi:MAG: hypothetical protein DRJ40_05760 [Thermoprotei archaeon]|nr:MAG: hypothetical protein DRJ40_05760 [Thermoprotei archaeon]
MIEKVEKGIKLYVKPKLVNEYLTLSTVARGYIGEQIALKLLEYKAVKQYIARALGLADYRVVSVGKPGKPDFLILDKASGTVRAIAEVKTRFEVAEEAMKTLKKLIDLSVEEAKRHARDYSVDHVVVMAIVMTDRVEILGTEYLYRSLLQYEIIELQD